MIGNKTWSIFLSLLLVLAAVTNNVLADGTTTTTTSDNIAIEIVEDKRFISSAKGNIGEGKAIFTKLEYQDLSEIQNNLGIKFRLKPSNDERKLTWFGIFNHGGNDIPIYVSSTVAIEEVKLKKMARMAIVKYLIKEKNENNKSSLTVASSNFPDASYTWKDQALNLNVTNNSDGEIWWYHEYRVYKGGSNSTSDLFYLRGDQEWLDADSDYNDHYTTLERYNSEWILQEQNGSDMLDPAPTSSGNQFSITITLPPNISWTSDTGGSVDISQDFDLSTDKVIWTATDQLFPGDLYHNLEDFGFTQGAEIESKLSNNGFKMDVYYTTWETYDWGFPPTDNWHDLIYYIDDLEKLRFED